MSTAPDQLACPCTAAYERAVTTGREATCDACGATLRPSMVALPARDKPRRVMAVQRQPEAFLLGGKRCQLLPRQ